MQYMANFFVDRARENSNRFDSLADELDFLIYQYPSEFLDLEQSHFQQIYFINE
jgi:hypothetical protein